MSHSRDSYEFRRIHSARWQPIDFKAVGRAFELLPGGAMKHIYSLWRGETVRTVTGEYRCTVEPAAEEEPHAS